MREERTQKSVYGQESSVNIVIGVGYVINGDGDAWNNEGGGCGIFKLDGSRH